ncbi:MAG: hypothetical protein JWM61_2776 [Micrococcaceae bacterium]|nr:hypothetical protein [Micrococcaceae bacterium]
MHCEVLVEVRVRQQGPRRNTVPVRYCLWRLKVGVSGVTMALLATSIGRNQGER